METLIRLLCSVTLWMLFKHMHLFVRNMIDSVLVKFQNERAYQKQPTIFQNKKRVLAVEGSSKEKLPRYHRNVGLGFKTPREVSLCSHTSVTLVADDVFSHDGLPRLPRELWGYCLWQFWCSLICYHCVTSAEFKWRKFLWFTSTGYCWNLHW